MTLYRIGVPSFTRDEGATLLAVHRSFPQMIRMLGNVDVVHTEYYALIWMVSRLAADTPADRARDWLPEAATGLLVVRPRSAWPSGGARLPARSPRCLRERKVTATRMPGRGAAGS